jgi:hypothetical protein
VKIIGAPAKMRAIMAGQCYSPRGAHVGRYEVLGLIGAGGMGEVYKARDPRLERTVAIKVSSEQFDERFEREARANAALNHPRICTLYDVGADYLVMEYLEGALVAGPMPIEKALRNRGGHCGRAGRGPPERYRPPRPEARKHPAHQIRHKAARLRPGQGPRARSGRIAARDKNPFGQGNSHWHSALHVAGAAGRKRGGPAQ